MNSMLVPGRVVAGVQADQRAIAEGAHLRVRGAPVRDVGVVERRLEELVLQHQPLVVAEPLVDRGQAVGQPVLPAADVALPRVVRAVGQPDLQVLRSGLVHDLDALEVVVDRLLPHRVVDVGQAAELVDVVLERVRVDRPQRPPRGPPRTAAALRSRRPCPTGCAGPPWAPARSARAPSRRRRASPALSAACRRWRTP